MADPLRDLINMAESARASAHKALSDIATRIKATAPTPPMPGKPGGAGQIRPEELLAQPAEAFKRIEEVLPPGAPKLSELAKTAPTVGESGEGKGTMEGEADMATVPEKVTEIIR